MLNSRVDNRVSNNVYVSGNNCDKRNGGACINADTYMEHVFYKMCMVNERKMKIFYEWQTNKEKYIHQTAIIAHDFPHYSVHDKEHSRTIVEAIEMFLGKWRIDRLSIGDVWLLLNAAYGHDIGMLIRYREVVDLWRNDSDFATYLENAMKNSDSDMQEAALFYKQLQNVLHDRKQMDGIEEELYKIYELTNVWPVIMRKNVMLLTSDYMRKHHQERSQKFFDNLAETLGINIAENRLYQLLGNIVYAHGSNFDYILEKLPKETNGFGNERMHPQFIAILLRLGDLLDLDNNRFDFVALEHFGNLPHLSEVQLKKHLSVTHFLITDTKIEVTEEVTDSETCEAVEQWFTYIREEVKNITSKWNCVAPRELGGCTFRDCTLKVLLNGNEYESIGKNHFEVDNKKFIDVLIGDKLYGDNLVFLREYIQNAMDATKLLLWINDQKKNGVSVFGTDARDSLELTPMNLQSYCLNEYGVDVLLELIEESEKAEDYKSKKPVLRIQIIDSGVGMDEECIKALSVIGTGWSGRKTYYEEIGKMPQWMQPTGSFGIGVQSGFMVTNKIVIETCGLAEKKGYRIELVSPRKNGRISYLIEQRDRIGTKIIVDIDWAKFLRENKIEYNSETDVFDYERILKAVWETVCKYLQERIPDSYIPIRVLYKPTAQERVIKQTIDSHIKKFVEKKKEIVSDKENNIQYYLSENMDMAYFWLADLQTFIQLTNNFTQVDKNQSDIYCYKGVKVGKIEENESVRKENYISKYLSMVVDVMGMKASESLLISRSEFVPNMQENFRVWGWKCFKIYIDVLAEKIRKYYDDDKSSINISNLNEKLKVMLLGALYFGENENIAYSCDRNAINAIYTVRYFAKKANKVVLANASVEFSEIYSIFANKKHMILWQIGTEGKSEQLNKGTLDIEDILLDSDGADEKEGSQMNFRERVAAALKRSSDGTCENGKYIISDNVLCSMLNEFQKRKKICEQYNIAGTFFGEGEMSVAAYYSETETEDLPMKFNDIISDAFENQKDYISITGEIVLEKYSHLFVAELPVKGKVEVKALKEENIILMPFEKEFYVKLKGKTTEGIVSWEDFKQIIVESKIWKRAVDWTTSYGKKSDGFPQREVVIKEYTELCKDFYDVYAGKTLH